MPVVTTTAKRPRNRHEFVRIVRYGIFHVVVYETLCRGAYALRMIDIHQSAVGTVSAFDDHAVFRKNRGFSAAARNAEHDAAFGSVVKYAVL